MDWNYNDLFPENSDDSDALDPEFPSGDWVGYWLEDPGGRYRQELRLTFRDGVLSGTGADSVAEFLVRGRYDAESKEVWWSKQYLGAHSVYYRGFREIKGIWGTWELDGTRGGFHIWPRSEGEFEAETATEEAEAPRQLVLADVGIAPGQGELADPQR